jgi:hypothetical protein
VTPRGTLALVAVAAVLVAYLLLVPPPAPPPLPEPLLSVPVESVDDVTLTWSDGQLRARRTDGGLRSDGGAILPPDAFGDLLEALSTLRAIETLPARDAMADCGLDARATTLVVSAGGAVVLQLRVGDHNPAWTGVYVQRSGSNDVVVVGALLHWELEKLHAMATR